MTIIRRTALTLALTLTAILGSTGSTTPAQASFSDSVSGGMTLSTATVYAPANFTGSVACTARSGTMSAAWNLSSSARVSGYTVTVYFSDGVVQTVPLPSTATSWSASINPYFITAYSVQYKITTNTDYGWFKDSARTAWFRC